MDELIATMEETLDRKKREFATGGREPTESEANMLHATERYLAYLKHYQNPAKEFDLELLGRQFRRIVPNARMETHSLTGEIVVYTGIDERGAPVKKD